MRAGEALEGPTAQEPPEALGTLVGVQEGTRPSPVADHEVKLIAADALGLRVTAHQAV